MDLFKTWLADEQPINVSDPEGCGKNLMIRHSMSRTFNVAVLHSNAQKSSKDVLQKLRQFCSITTGTSGCLRKDNDWSFTCKISICHHTTSTALQRSCILIPGGNDNGFYDDDLEFQCPPGDDRSRHTNIAVFWQWSAISVDKENKEVVWNELDMTSVFYVFRFEPAWYKFQAMSKLVSGQFASRWVPNLWAEESVYLAVAVMAMGWKSSCGILKTDSQKALFPPQAHGSRVRPIQRGSARWSCSAKRQATWYKRPFEHNFASSCAPTSSG